ncbi:MAG: PEP/pyruvate-binding domain-containing protein [Acidimicrobiia bacterium]|nr:PEP/pyruvate-binding domain-containing protein [Acidimicrobiia bacterium]
MDRGFLVLDLDDDSLTVENAGGKAANLSRLANSGFPVPPGFVLGVSAYAAHVRASGLLDQIAVALESVAGRQDADLGGLAAKIERWFLESEADPELLTAVADHYAAMGAPPVAVRSSATLEDLADFSYAGQQETFLNVRGEGELRRAILKCWASLFSERAIAYRIATGEPGVELGIGVVVQELVPARAAGVLFTADPRSGNRREMVVEAVSGLGEGLVSGRLEPDRYRIDAGTGSVLESHRGERRSSLQPMPAGGTQMVDETDVLALSDELMGQLVDIGNRASDLFGGPQDIEWALADDGMWVLQSRWITSLYPVPDGFDPNEIHVFVSYASTQGFTDPITPLGRDLIRCIHTAAGRVFGYEQGVDSPETMFDAGERLWMDATSLFRSRLGRRVLHGLLRAFEPSAERSLRSLRRDPRLATKGGVSLGFAWRVLPAVAPMIGRLLVSLFRPHRESRLFRMEAEIELDRIRARFADEAGLGGRAELAVSATMQMTEAMLPRFIPRYWAGVLAQGVFNSLARSIPGGSELALRATRGLPNNVTSEMNLRLAEVAEVIADDPSSVRLFADETASSLSVRFMDRRLPAPAQHGVEGFLEEYGARGIGEIDVGRARWGDEPEPVLQNLKDYVRLTEEVSGPRQRFADAVLEAEEAISRVARELRGTRLGLPKSRLASWAAVRMRALTGLRESPKFNTVRVQGLARDAMLESGNDLAEQGILEEAEDVFYLKADELRLGPPALDGSWRTLVRDRKAAMQREEKRRRLPGLLLSDGRAFYESVEVHPDDSSDLTGDPVSPGVVEGRVRVISDPSTERVAPGEILVCHAADPAWTPLFLAAGGVVMELGGLMTHGSVVAREFGIPAVVGVRQATSLLQTGQQIRLDGTAGQISIISAQSDSTGSA